MSWQSEPCTLEQVDFLTALSRRVLGRWPMTSDFHKAYEHAGVTRIPDKMPPNMTGLQADRLIKWLEHVESEAKVKTKDTGPDPCIYCAFGCELCEEAS